ncbi:uncharacterized protein FIBRA_04034 [Fibroporia radiculosa]|uniref:YDG domain-containing protein n=1 Tax=Fibroporia radiculosa TaxID=599839 RepID=J4I9Y3_9APHY|nr:uncharacterized protein FIBRA_04034 [Fibroporia radiculosa]CCM01961.1 predicted protein [Fibroporia radiculosa]
MGSGWTEYDEACANARASSKALLLSMGELVPPMVKKSSQKPRAPRKRKAADEEASDQDETRSTPKIARLENVSSGDTASLRRSGRNRGKKVDYASESVGHTLPRLTAVRTGISKMDSEPKSANRRTHDPKTFGAIPGIPIGTWWLTREECSRDAIHAPWVAGIAGSKDGAYSVALSGGYEDDVDLGNAFTFTGAGGRDLKGTKSAPKNLRTAPQSCDQSFENPSNAALKKSCETKKPVRVIRGYKLQSDYAPHEGYRYDGLDGEGIKSQGIFSVRILTRFNFQRMAGQAPLLIYDDAAPDRSSPVSDGSEIAE